MSVKVMVIVFDWLSLWVGYAHPTLTSGTFPRKHKMTAIIMKCKWMLFTFKPTTVLTLCTIISHHCQWINNFQISTSMTTLHVHATSWMRDLRKLAKHSGNPIEILPRTRMQTRHHCFHFPPPICPSPVLFPLPGPECWLSAAGPAHCVSALSLLTQFTLSAQLHPWLWSQDTGHKIETKRRPHYSPETSTVRWIKQ